MLEVNIQKKLRDYTLEASFSTDVELMGILGASGCGKSMTLKCIAGIETPDRGRIVLDGRVLFDSDRKINLKPQERKVGYLFQSYALFPNMTVLQNIRAGVRSNNLSGSGRDRTGSTRADAQKAAGVTAQNRVIEDRINRLIELFRLEGLENEYPRRLSGGQQQRVALARILASEPEILLLDEPFSAMDAYLREELQLLVKDTVLKEFPGSCIMVTHDRDEAYRMCDKLMIMESGRIVEQGKTKELFAGPRTFTGARVTGCKNISRIRDLGGGMVEAVDFGIRLYLGDEDLKNVTAIGIRAHDFEAVYEDIPHSDMSVGDMPMGDMPTDDAAQGDTDGNTYTVQSDDRIRDSISDRKEYNEKSGTIRTNIIEISPENAEIIASPFEDTVVFSPIGTSCRLWWKRKDKEAKVPSKIYINPSKILRLSDWVNA